MRSKRPAISRHAVDRDRVSRPSGRRKTTRSRCARAQPPGAARHQLVHEPFGVNPTQCVGATRNWLSSSDTLMAPVSRPRRQIAPQSTLAGDPHGIRRDRELVNAEPGQVRRPRRRIVEPAPPHSRRGPYIHRPQQRQEDLVRLRCPRLEHRKAVFTDLRGDAVVAGMPGSSVAHRDPVRSHQPGAQSRVVRL